MRRPDTSDDFVDLGPRPGEAIPSPVHGWRETGGAGLAPPPLGGGGARMGITHLILNHLVFVPFEIFFRKIWHIWDGKDWIGTRP